MTFDLKTTLLIEYRNTTINGDFVIADKPIVDIIVGYKLLKHLKEGFGKFPVDYPI